MKTSNLHAKMVGMSLMADLNKIKHCGGEQGNTIKKPKMLN